MVTLRSIGPKFLIVLVMTGLGSVARGADDGSGFWHEGQAWRLSVKLYGGDWVFAAGDGRPRDEDRVVAEYHVRVRVSRVVPAEGGETVEIEFAPEDDAPAAASDATARLTLDAKTWAPLRGMLTRRAELPGQPTESAVNCVRFGDRSFVAPGDPSGFPLPIEWVVQRKDTEVGPDRKEERGPAGTREPHLRFSRTSTKSTAGEVIVIEAEYSTDSESAFRAAVRCTWRPGEYWWHSFRRTVQGHTILEAEMVEYIPPTGEDDRKTPEPDSPRQP